MNGATFKFYCCSRTMAPKKSKKNSCECDCNSFNCRPPMGRICYSMGGILMLLAGLVFLFAAYNAISTMSLDIAAGVLLLFYGIGSFMHVTGACPMCNMK